jgi:endonuclease/exonuclease/phosphatase family metal-dependent hydrolase
MMSHANTIVKVVGIFGLVLLGCACASQSEGQSKGQLEDHSLRVMTFNLRYDNPGDGENRWELRREFAAAVIQESGASLIGIQEGLHRQVEWLDDVLPDFTYVGVGRDDGAQAGEYSAIFIDTTRFEIVDSGTFWLSKTPERPSVGWDASMERIATYAIVLERGSEPVSQQTPLLILNAHFDHIGQEARLESARLIRDKIQVLRKFRETTLPVIAMGDFNTGPGTPPIEVFSSFLQDSYIASETPPVGPATTFNGFNVIPDGYRELAGRIDYIFISDEFRVNSYSAIDDLRNDRYVSDHFPILIDLTIEY